MATRGLVLLAKDIFSGVSSVSFDNVFSNTYKQYKIVANITSPSSPYTYMRMRASGSDNSSSNYNRQFINANSTTLGSGRSTSQTRWDGITESNTYENMCFIEVLNPFQTAYTSCISITSDTSIGSIIWQANYFGITVTTSYDGFTIAPDSSTISGSITVYGLGQ